MELVYKVTIGEVVYGEDLRNVRFELNEAMENMGFYVSSSTLESPDEIDED